MLYAGKCKSCNELKGCKYTGTYNTTLQGFYKGETVIYPTPHCPYRKDNLTDEQVEQAEKNDGKCENYKRKDLVKFEMPYIDFLLLIEQALRSNIVVWEEEEYKDIAKKIAEKLND